MLSLCNASFALDKDGGERDSKGGGSGSGGGALGQRHGCEGSLCNTPALGEGGAAASYAFTGGGGGGVCRGGCTGWRWCSCCSARESVKAVVVAVMGRQQGLVVFLAGGVRELDARYVYVSRGRVCPSRTKSFAIAARAANKLYAARTEYTAVSLPEAHAQIRRLKAELADKDHELQLYLHVAARATDEAERSSHGKLAAEVHDLR